MQKKSRRNSTDPSQVVAAIIFILLLLSLILLGVLYESGSQFTGGFFDDVSNAMKWK